ncbi:MAG: flagellar biosynthetic protein FliO [Lachnospiraceae bacterium]|nr:flagellar biosynthetic protein FliO [Lachnospiraceae bacterium]
MILTVSGSMNSYLQFMTVLILFVFVLGITWFVTKWIGGYQKTMSRNVNIEVVETFHLANNKYIQIIRVGKKYLAVAIGKDSVTMLTEVSEEDLVLSDGTDGVQPSFKELLEKLQKKKLSNIEDDRNKDE